MNRRASFPRTVRARCCVAAGSSSSPAGRNARSGSSQKRSLRRANGACPTKSRSPNTRWPFRSPKRRDSRDLGEVRVNLRDRCCKRLLAIREPFLATEIADDVAAEMKSSARHLREEMMLDVVVEPHEEEVHPEGALQVACDRQLLL